MKATIDEAGRLTLPDEIREAAGLVPGIVVDIRIRDGVIELESQTVRRRFVQYGHVTTLEADIPLPPITSHRSRPRWSTSG